MGLMSAIKRNPKILAPFFLVCVMMTGSGMITPFLSIYAKSFGVASTLAGLLVTSFGIGRLLANFPTGLLCQRIGRKPLVCIGPALIAFAAVGACFARDFSTLVFWRALQGVGSGIYMTAITVSVADLAPAEERAEFLSLFQASAYVGLSIGPAFGGVLAEQFGMIAPFWGYAVICSAATLIAMFSFQETLSYGPDKESHRQETGIHLFNYGFCIVLLATFSSFFTRAAVDQYILPLIGHESFRLELDMIGLALTGNALGVLAVVPWAGRIIRRWGSGIVAAFSGVMLAASIAMIAVASSPVLYFLGVAAMGVFGGLNNPAITNLLIAAVRKEFRGASFGVQRTVGDIGLLTGPILMGLSRDLLGLDLSTCLFVNLSLLLIVSAVVLVGVPRQS